MQKFFLVILFFALTSCGGGGGGSSTSTGTTTSSFSGVAIDGNLYLATAFLDLNGNGTYDSGEPTATTDSSGAFTLTATADQINSHSVVVSAIAGTTIDQDTPNTPITSSMMMLAPAGSPSVISPLTTQVSAKMAAGMSLTAAKTAVQTELGLTGIDVTKNYVLEKATNSAYSDAHKVAASVAEVLKNIDSQSSSSTTLASKLSALTTQVTSSVAPITTQIKSSTSLDDARTAINAQIGSAVNVYTIGGSISGLTASGLILANGTNTVSPVSGATSFTFSSKKAANGAYAVTVQTNPNAQTCAISNGSGTVVGQSISNIAVTCTTNPGALSGTISGLTTSGLVLKNGSDELSVSSGSSTFQFGSTVTSGTAYSVTVKTQPTGKTCSISNGTGAMVSAGISNVQVTCASNSYTLGGSISGLSTSGLKLKNGSEVLAINSGSAAFTFSTQVSYGGGYAVSIDTQPTNYTCSLSNSSGTMGAGNVSSVQVTCAINTYAVSGTISGLTSSGLRLKNGSNIISISNGANSFTFDTLVAVNASYQVTVDTQPTGKYCEITNGSGTYAGVTVNVLVSCRYAYVSGSASGLSSIKTLGLINNSQERISMNSPSGLSVNFSFAEPVSSNGNFNIKVDSYPNFTYCSSTNNSGTITNSNISNVSFSCNEYLVSTFAGWGAGYVNGSGVNARFDGPSGMAFDSVGNMYVADFRNNRIRKVTPQGIVTTFAGTGAQGALDGQALSATFDVPLGIAIDSSDNLYVSDWNNNKIRKITQAGVVSTFAGSGVQGSSDGTGSLATFSAPNHVVFDSNGNLIVGDQTSKKLRKISSNGAVTTIATVDSTGSSVSFQLLLGLGIDSSNNLYISEGQTIKKITSSGVVTVYIQPSDLVIGADPGASNAYHINGMALDALGNIFALQANTSQLLLITPTKNISVAVGHNTNTSNGSQGNTDGSASVALLTAPLYLAIGKDGAIYISSNDRIRKVALAP